MSQPWRRSGKYFRPGPGLAWVNQGIDVLIVSVTGNSQTLTDIEASLWRCLHQSYNWKELLEFYSAYTNVPEDDGEAFLVKLLQDWVKIGLLEVQDG